MDLYLRSCRCADGELIVELVHEMHHNAWHEILLKEALKKKKWSQFSVSLSLSVTLFVCASSRITRFFNVQHLSIHISKNFGAENTRVYYIGLRGEYSEVSLLQHQTSTRPNKNVFFIKKIILHNMSFLVLGNRGERLWRVHSTTPPLDGDRLASFYTLSLQAHRNFCAGLFWVK